MDQLLQKARSMSEGSDVEELCERLAQISERRSCSQIDASAHAGTGDQQRYVFARMIGARGGRIVAVVGGDYLQVVLIEQRPEISEERIKAFEVRGVTRHVVAMAV